MAGSSKIVRKIKNIGTVSGLSITERKAIALVNVLSFSLLLLSIASAAVAFAWKMPSASFALAFPLIWFVVFHLNMRRLYHIAASVFCLGGLITVAGLAVVFDHNQFYFWLIPLSLSPFLIFSSSYRQWGNIFSGGIWLAFSVVLYVSTKDIFSVVISLSSLLMLSLGIYARNISIISEFQLQEERGHSEKLLRNFIPKKFVRRLMSLGDEAPMIAQRYEDVIVLFADIVNFTPMSEELPPEQLVQVLNELFTEFDILIAKYGLEKIKTIGDAYMIAAGVPEPMEAPEIAVADFSLEMRGAVQKVDQKWKRDLDIRIGIHSGPVVAGVIGIQKYAFDLWGDTVNVAARMESHGLPGQIHLSEVMADKLKAHYNLTQRGWVDVKGKGMMQTFWLKGKDESVPSRIVKKSSPADEESLPRERKTKETAASTKKPLGQKKATTTSERKSKATSAGRVSAETLDRKSKRSKTIKPQPSRAKGSIASKIISPKSKTAKKSSAPPQTRKRIKKGARSGVFRRTLSPDAAETRSDLFRSRSPRAGASTLPPTDIESLKKMTQEASAEQERSSALRKDASSDGAEKGGTKSKGANAFRRPKK